MLRCPMGIACVSIARVEKNLELPFPRSELFFRSITGTIMGRENLRLLRSFAGNLKFYDSHAPPEIDSVR